MSKKRGKRAAPLSRVGRAPRSATAEALSEPQESAPQESVADSVPPLVKGRASGLTLVASEAPAPMKNTLPAAPPPAPVLLPPLVPQLVHVLAESVTTPRTPPAPAKTSSSSARISIKTGVSTKTLPLPRPSPPPPKARARAKVEDPQPAAPVADDTMDRFFADGERHSHHELRKAVELAVAEEEQAELDARHFDPLVRERRERFQKTVRALVVLAAVMSVVAFARGMMMRSAATADKLHGASASESLSQPEPVETAPPRVDVPPVETAKVDPKSVAIGPVAIASAASSATEPAGKSAKEEKIAAKSFLERGKAAEAIEAGERSVAADPTDGEAWLLLGAAYQEKNRNADARKAFSSCLQKGKTGPLAECAALLR